ncbi:MAG: ribonuclease P protein component [Pseudomonadota bacterium]|nr:ribonuclease P protein component [Pseudomonadota bacterium]
MSNTTFPKRVRIRTQHEFKAVFQNHNRLSEHYFSVVTSPNTVEFARLGLSIAKRHIKRSVDRNLIKRVLREAFRHEQENLAGLDIVVMVKYPIPDLNKAEMNVWFKRLLLKIEQQLKRSSSA